MPSAPDPRFEGFDILQTTYKHVGDHGIRADVLVPKTPYSGKRPVIIRFHGGGLVMGDSLYSAFSPRWLSDIALKYDAVLLTANYRLLPQATGLDIYDDVEDFWAWLHSPALQDLLEKHTTPVDVDLTRILVVGESAGGLLTINTALAHASQICAAIAAYPCIDFDSPDFTTPRTTILPFGQHTPETIIDEYLSSFNPKIAVSSTTEHRDISFSMATIQHGRLGAWYAKGSEGSTRRHLLYPMERLEQPEIQIPRGGITILHGRQDSVVPVTQSEPFVKRAREVTEGKPGGDKIVFVVRDGEHGFDQEVPYEEEWLRDALKIAVEAWLE
ncbi:hypothetical protein BDV12DRAFT_138336 [Aspergillus spectabilis]